jgi:hypothetical protein
VALKNICVIPRRWTTDDYAGHTCTDGSHSHVSHAQLQEKERDGRVVWLHRARSRREASVVYILESHPGAATSSPACGPINTGLSNRVGEVLALAVYDHQAWAAVMLSSINCRRERPSRGVGES